MAAMEEAATECTAATAADSMAEMVAAVEEEAAAAAAGFMEAAADAEEEAAAFMAAAARAIRGHSITRNPGMAAAPVTAWAVWAAVEEIMVRMEAEAVK